MGCLFAKPMRRRDDVTADGDSDEDGENRYKFIYGNPLNSRPNILTLTSELHEEPADSKIHI
jgi:hypothetical protein